MPHVILVEPHLHEHRRFLRGLRKLGATVTGLGCLRPEQLDGELRHLLDRYEHIPDLSDRTDMYAAVRRIQDRGPWVDRLETLHEQHTDAVAEVREVASIPGVPYEIVSLTRDKVRLKSFLRERDIYPTPATLLLSAQQAIAYAAEVGFPLVLKPRIGSGQASVHRVDDIEQLRALVSSLGEGVSGGHYVLERFADGHEGFFDGLLCRGQIVFSAATHFYPSVLTAMRDRSASPVVVHTNRLEQDGYDELRSMNTRALRALSLLDESCTTLTHLEWFTGREGMWLSELGLHPPPDGLWELYCEANGVDLYAEWARAIAHGQVDVHARMRFSAGLVSIRPTADGTVMGYEGIETIGRRYGQHIFRMHLPPPGAHTQPFGSGYLANAYVFALHEDYDALRAILEDIGRTVKMIAAGA